MSVRFPNLSLVIIRNCHYGFPFVAIISQGYLSIQFIAFHLQHTPTFNPMPPKKSSSRSPVKKSKDHLSPTDSAVNAVPKPRRVIPSQSSSSSLPSFFDFVEPPPPDDDISAEPTFQVGHVTPICAHENNLLDRLQKQVLPGDDNPDLFLAATAFAFTALPDDPESEDDELDEVRLY